jgi:hypothetical protein
VESFNGGTQVGKPPLPAIRPAVDLVHHPIGKVGAQGAKPLPALPQRLLGPLVLGDIDGISGKQGPAAKDKGKLDRRIEATVQLFLEFEHLPV